MLSWDKNILNLSDLLRGIKGSDLNLKDLDIDEAFSRWFSLTAEIHRDNKAVFFVGNGASASMASHFAADLAKNAGIKTEFFSDISLITALANDYTYEEVFSRPIQWKMKANDLLIAISSSGNSPNIVNSVKAARDIGGKVITLSAMTCNNRIRQSGDLNFYVPAETYGDAETCHAAILHYWLDQVIANSTGNLHVTR